MKLRNPVPEVLTALAALWSRISSAIGRSQAEKAREQQSEIDAMDREIQGMKGDKQ
jgi:hypothetical protein